MTIHRALAGAGWYDWELGTWHEESDGRVVADTLIIDESSMVDITLLGTLFVQSIGTASSVSSCRRPPPDPADRPGSPVFDLIALMQRDDRSAESGPFANRLNELTHNYRVAEGTADRPRERLRWPTGSQRPLIWVSLARAKTRVICAFGSGDPGGTTRARDR